MKTLLKVVIIMLHQNGREKSLQDRLKPMLICHCQRVNDRKIREAVENGARTVGRVGRFCGAGTRCGGCVRAIAEIVEDADIRAGAERAGAERVAHVSRLPVQRRPLPVTASLPAPANLTAPTNLPLAAE